MCCIVIYVLICVVYLVYIHYSSSRDNDIMSFYSYLYIIIDRIVYVYVLISRGTLIRRPRWCFRVPITILLSMETERSCSFKSWFVFCVCCVYRLGVTWRWEETVRCLILVVLTRVYIYVHMINHICICATYLALAAHCRFV